jgi:hypothetical protein
MEDVFNLRRADARQPADLVDPILHAEGPEGLSL